MDTFLSAVLTASFHGSIIILAVLILRLVLKKAPKKYICFLWMLAGLRLLLPIPLQSRFSLQPRSIALPISADLSGLLAIVWIAVACIVSIYSILSYLHLRSKVLDAVKVRGGWESDRIETAFVLGFIKPKIYIPAGMTGNTRKQILAHERTHLDKGDHWIKMIGFLALALHWFNPLVWISYILLCKDIEMACDERVVQFMELDERKAYASALLQCSTNRVHYAACPVAFGEVSVKYRIKSALNYKKPSFWISLLGVFSIAFVAVCLLTTPADAVEIVVDRQEKLAESSRQDPIVFTAPTMPASEPNPDWGLDLIADIDTPTGGKIVYEIENRFIALTGEMYGSDAHLEKWNGSEWEFLSAISDPLKMAGFGESQENRAEYWAGDVDWTLSCGSLPAGDYRFVQTLSTGEDADARTEILRAPFHIYREQLPTAEEEALARCTTALDKMLSAYGFAVTQYQKNFKGELVPYRTIYKYGNQYKCEHYLGEYTTWYNTGDDAQYDIRDWDQAYRLNQNRKFLFPEGQSRISQEEISFCSVWADYAGTSYRGKDTYQFDSDGKLISVDRITEVLAENGAVAETRQIRMEAREQSAVFGPDFETQYVPEDSFTAQQNSPWGIFFRVDDDLLKPSGGEVWLGTNAVGVSNYTADGSYWLEKRVGSRWERLGGPEKTASWGEETIKLTAQTQIRMIDWTADYGKLDAGIYRMGKFIYNGSESIISYAEFFIGETGGVFGEGGEEAMARVDAALARLEENGYRVEQHYGPHTKYGTQETMPSVYWNYNHTQVWDIYHGGEYSHSCVSKADDHFYNDWMKRSWYNEEYDCMYFADGYSLISDSEITFVHSYGRTGWADTSRLFTYRFDENGELCEIIEQGLYSEFNGYYTRYVVTDTPKEEIQQWVETKQAEQ